MSNRGDDDVRIVRSEYIRLCRGRLPIRIIENNNYIRDWCIRTSENGLRLYTINTNSHGATEAAIVHYHLAQNLDARRVYILTGVHGKQIIINKFLQICK